MRSVELESLEIRRKDIEKVKLSLKGDDRMRCEKSLEKLTKYSSMGFSRALLYDFCISVCLSAWAMCKALASNLPAIRNKLS